jgi:hypothetical protein
MGTMNKASASILQSLMREQGWDLVIKCLAEYMDELKEPVTGNSAFEELRALHKQQGGIEALREFFDRLESKAFDV